eukprot:1039957-Pleurochrysis_carterae.AAC.3
MGLSPTAPTKLYIDNAGALELAKDRRSCQRSRDIDRRDLKVREYVSHGFIDVRKVDTADNVADVFIKTLSESTHRRHVRSARGAGPAHLPQWLNWPSPECPSHALQ